MKVYAIGNITLDIVFKSIDDMPAWGVEIPVKNITYRVAGNLGNFSLALKKIGIAPFIIGNLGGDDNGKFILKELNKNGLDTSTIRIEKKYKTSVTATIVKKDGERSFITYAGQLLKIDRNFIFDSLNKIEPNSIAILCSLFQFPNLKIKDIIEFFKMLKQKNCIILLDPGWDINGWDKQTISDVKKLLRYVDIFLPNLEEAREITKINDEIKIIRYLKKEGSKDLIIKMGKQGATACIDNKIFKSETFPATRLDSTGAGDTFDAAVVYGIANKIPPEKILKIANAASTFLVSRFENRFPTIKDINKILLNNSTFSP